MIFKDFEVTLAIQSNLPKTTTGGPEKSGRFGQVVAEKSIDSKHARCIV